MASTERPRTTRNTMQTQAAKTSNPYRSTFHRDGSVTLWDVYCQTWRRVRSLSDAVSSSLSCDERDRINAHFARHA